MDNTQLARNKKHNCTQKNKTKSCIIDDIFIPLNQFRVQKMAHACALPERNSQNFPRQHPMRQAGAVYKIKYTIKQRSWIYP